MRHILQDFMSAYSRVANTGFRITAYLKIAEKIFSQLVFWRVISIHGQHNIYMVLITVLYYNTLLNKIN